MHIGAVGIEYTCDFYLQVMLAVIVEKQGFSTAFALVITGTSSDGVDVPPVTFCLGVDFWVAIYFAG